MANAWKRAKPATVANKLLLLLLFSLFAVLLFFFSISATTNTTAASAAAASYPLPPFDCVAAPQAAPVIANLVEGVPRPFLYSLADLGSLPDKPHKNIARTLKGKRFRLPDISAAVQDVLGRVAGGGVVVDVGANVGMAAFAAAAMGFRVLAFEPVFENLQRICDGVFLNRAADLVTVFAAAASDRAGNITIHKVLFNFLLDLIVT